MAEQQKYPSLPFAVNAQYIKDFSFENPNPLKNFQENKEQPELAINVDVRAKSVAEKSFEVDLQINCSAKRKDETAFIVELVYSGIFTVGEVPQEVLAPLLLIEGPRMLFPFARQVIADTTREGGFPPLSLAPIDFAALYKSQQEQGGVAVADEKEKKSTKKSASKDSKTKKTTAKKTDKKTQKKSKKSA